MTFIEEKIRMTLGNLESTIVTHRRRITDIEYVRCGYKIENTPPADAEWTPYTRAPLDFERDEHAWFRFAVDVPEVSSKECVFLKVRTGKEGQWDATNPQGTVFIDSDTCVQALDTNHTEVLLMPGHHDINLYFYAGMSASSLFLSFELITKNTAVEKLWYDIQVPFAALKCLDKNSYDYTAIINALDQTCLLLDFRDKTSPEYFASVEEADAFLVDEFYGKVCGKDANGEIALIGHTHIDVAWKWTLAQTVEKSQRSFSTVIALMDRYPDYLFMSSQPQLYQYVKETDPVLYGKILEKVKEGRWETEGAMWLEADTNLVSGESLIRQILYGKKFMKEEFGHDDRILWLPDVFGYSAALPQILKKCGVDRFFTTKISWCETDKFPHDNFVWEGIDGSEVFAVLSDAYVKRLEPSMILGAARQHVDKKYSSTHISTFGFGDGGGGPTQEMLEQYERLKCGLPGFPRVTMRKAGETIEEIKEQFDCNAKALRFVPRWVGELYLEMHRGTYTTMAENKKNNRLSELLYQSAETVASAAAILVGAEYPKQVFDDKWHVILKNQFHDIIPGSSIRDVYEVSRREYAEVLETGTKVRDEALDALTAQISTDGGLFVYNPAPFARTEVLNKDGLTLIAENVPAHGWTVARPAVLPDGKVVVNLDSRVLENDILRVRFDEKWQIVSIYDKRAGREVIVPGAVANELQIFEDYPRSYDAWEITEYYKQKMWIADDVASVGSVVRPMYGAVIVTRKYGKSVIVQEIGLRKDSARLDFVTDIDWHEDHVLLKAAFPLDIHAVKAKYEIQFGHVERPSHRNTSWDQAKFEVSAHKWADLSEGDYGAAILNDCKYGYSCEENVLKISLLKAPTDPNPVADRGAHHFTYSLFPHVGSLTQSGVVREAYLLNQPVVTRPISKQEGKLPETYSVVSSDKSSAVVETFKRAEDGRGYIVRFYDSLNRKTAVTLNFGFPVTAACSCDMLENDEAPVAVEGNSVTVSLANFEVKTIRVIPG